MTDAVGTFLPFHIPDIGEQEIEAVVETLRSGWLTSGPKVQEFERTFASYVGAKHALAVNSCTAALHLALEAAGIGPGDEVLVPTMTFAATAETVIYRGARPVLVDSDSATLNLDPNLLIEAITPRTRAVIPVHFGGHPCAMDDILDIAQRFGLSVIEDAAHALPASYRGRTIGSIGHLTCFSFYATKTLTTGEGGMVTTDSDYFADTVRTSSLHGISKDAWKRYTPGGSWYYEILRPGYKYNMPDMAAAMGLVQLRRCEALHQIRARYAAIYNEQFADVEEIERPVALNGIQHAWHLYVIRLRLERLRIDRDQFIQHLTERNIGTSVHFIPLHLHPYYRVTYDYTPEDFPVAHASYRRMMSLPLYSRMTESEVMKVAETVKSITRQYRR